MTQTVPELQPSLDGGRRSPQVAPESDERLPRWAMLAAAGLVTAGIALRLGSTSPLWLDEALSANIASLPVEELLDALRRDGHPPLYYLLLHGWIKVVGDGDHAVRGLSAVFALSTLPLLWAAARRAGGLQCAVATTVLYATSPFAIRYATETRMYALVAFLVVAGWLAVRRAEERPSLLRLALVSAVSGALLLTHYWSFFLLTAVMSLLLLRAWRIRSAGGSAIASVRLTAAVAAGSVLFIPWLPAFLAQVGSTGTPWGAPNRPAAVFFTSLNDWGGGPFGEATFLGLSLVLLGVLVLLGRAVGGTRIELDLATRPGARTEWLVVTLTMALAIAASYASAAAFATRYTSVIHPLVVLLAGLGVLVLPRRGLRLAVVGLLALVGLTFGAANFFTDRTQAREFAEAIEAGRGPGDLVVYCPDQLGPATNRLLEDGPPGITFPDAGDPRFVDWVDYAERMDRSSPEAFAQEVVERADGATIWLVWSSGYRSVERVCEALVEELDLLRPRGREVVELGEFFEAAVLHRYAP